MSDRLLRLLADCFILSSSPKTKKLQNNTVMKNYKLYIASLVIVLVTVVGCDKEVQSEQNLKPLTPSDVDANAGTWKPILLTSNNQITVAPPAPVSSDAYKAELQSIKDLQA